MENPRVTIILDKKLENKLRVLQANKITTSNTTCSFSTIVNLVLEEGLRHYSNSKKRKKQ